MESIEGISEGTETLNSKRVLVSIGEGGKRRTRGGGGESSAGRLRLIKSFANLHTYTHGNRRGSFATVGFGQGFVEIRIVTCATLCIEGRPSLQGDGPRGSYLRTFFAVSNNHRVEDNYPARLNRLSRTI